MERCKWVGSNQLMVAYHDKEWCVPINDDKILFEMLILEGAQAGLSWSTILKRREDYQKALDNFDYREIARYDNKKIQELFTNSGIIRNKLKIRSMIKNAQIFLKMQEEFGSFSNYIWSFSDNKQIKNTFKSISELPTKTEISDRISKDLKKRGMNFVGPTIIYAFMQAIGMVNDHEVSCFRYNEINKLVSKQ